MFMSKFVTDTLPEHGLATLDFMMSAETLVKKFGYRMRKKMVFLI